MAIFMKIKFVDGNCSAKGYENWIELDSLTFSASRAIRNKLGEMSNRNRSAPSFSEVEIVKGLDKASNPFFDQVHSPEIMKEVEIHVCHSGDSLSPTAKYVFYDVLVSNHQTFVDADGEVFENISLSYTKLNRTYVHNNGNPYTSGYDLETVQKT